MRIQRLLLALLLVLPIAILVWNLKKDPNPQPVAQQVTTPNSNPDLLTFEVISDIHISTSDGGTQSKFTHVLEDINRAAPASDLLVINGDLSNGAPEDYSALRNLLSSTPHPPTEVTIGNHEFYAAFYDKSNTMNKDTFPNGDTDEKALQRFLDFAGRQQVYTEKVIKDYHFLFLGSEKSRMSDMSYNDDAYLSDTQLAWLKEKLQGLPTDKPAFVFLHQPLPYTVSGTARAGWNRTVIQHEALKKLLAAHPNLILFSGHTHINLDRPTTFVRDSFLMVNDSSAGRPYNPDRNTRPDSEGLIVEVRNREVTIRGRDFLGQKWIEGVAYTVKP
ncbi:metallophosphoesterase family protein [Tumebacillus permanentifrigoris]|uniref:Calcineurin-like phosphoesterase family protein n=1 Tax=Tumebacillus permanentifrigoris TaxID=378543 RepID=A0A316DE32_9BACL|nr:metallophosphoesterase [Tumebacillus permanentifrigoris]PWK16487.1 calcineurin-like phosphoesterase family protein [Tumebacillus permanentifrigoris]